MNSKYKDCQYYFEGRCRCMDFSFNQDFYECPQCKDVPYCYYRQLKKCEQKLEKIKEKINAHCAVCETMRRPKCDDCILSWLLEIIEGAKE